MIAAFVVASVVGAGASGAVSIRGAVIDGAVARTKAVVDYAARAVAKNRNFTGDLRRAWQHMARVGERRRAGDNVAALRHAMRARELGCRAIVANGWKLKRAFTRESETEKSVLSGVAVGELDRTVDEIAVREEFLLEPRR